MTLRFLTAGESHGKALTAIIEGMVAGLSLAEDDIQRDLRRRQGGHGRGGRQKIESDRAEIVSGVRHGRTLGSPIALLITNRDWENWRDVMSVEAREQVAEPVTRLRPGHADVAGAMKYGADDVRDILERASARETASRVAVGAVARRFLEEFGIAINSHTVAVGEVEATKVDEVDWQAIEESPARCADAEAGERMLAAIDAARAEGNSLGGVTEVRATGVPIGLGSHVQWDRRLAGLLAQAVMSIPSVKGMEIGDGFAGSRMQGSESQDVILPQAEWQGRPWRRVSNHAGGLEGSMTNGEDIVLRAALKPISTLVRTLPSADLATGQAVDAHYERSDVCIVPAAGVIAEAMVAAVLATVMLDKFGGDHLHETLRNCRAYLETVGPHPSSR